MGDDVKWLVLTIAAFVAVLLIAAAHDYGIVSCLAEIPTACQGRILPRP